MVSGKKMTIQEAADKGLLSQDIAAEKREQLQRIFPEVFSENGIDFEQLRRVLGDWAEPDRERFGLTWPGKADCMKVIQAPGTGTLKPARSESVNFDETENVFIEGDNLEVLKLMQKAYFGKIKMIYIDPPYNTGNEFIYPDKFSETLETYLKYTDQIDGNGSKFSTNTEAEGRYHSNWLNMMYPRLYLARNLLREDGAIFVSIGQDELPSLLHLCFQIFGEENLVTISSRVTKTGGQKGTYFSPSVDYILVFARDVTCLKPFREPISENIANRHYTNTETNGDRKGERYATKGLYQAYLEKRANQRFYIECPDGSFVIPPGVSFPNEKNEGSQVEPNDGDGVWRWTYKRYKQEKKDNNIEFIRSDRSPLLQADGTRAEYNVYYKIWLKNRLDDGQIPGNVTQKFINRHSSEELKGLDIPFDFAKPSALIKYLMVLVGVSENDTVMDFFAGSASTAHAVIKQASESGEKIKFICVQLPEKTREDSEERRRGYKTISQIGMERIRRVIKNVQKESLAPSLACGFRAFNLACSNFRIWDGDIEKADSLEEQLDSHIDHIDSESGPEDILYELLLKAGYELTTKVEKRTLAGKDVYAVDGGAFLICLEKEITEELIDAMAEAEPRQVICLDEGFKGDDQLKANAVQTFKSRAESEETEIVFRTV